MDKCHALLILVKTVITFVIYSAFVISVIHFTNEAAYNRVNITGLNCRFSTYIGRKKIKKHMIYVIFGEMKTEL